MYPILEWSERLEARTRETATTDGSWKLPLLWWPDPDGSWKLQRCERSGSILLPAGNGPNSRGLRPEAGVERIGFAFFAPSRAPDPVGGADGHQYPAAWPSLRLSLAPMYTPALGSRRIA
jgi:hypothetical protein